MTTLAVILARAGSRGLPDKHLRPLLGRPVIDHTFDHARDARRLDRTVVTSDCPNVRQVARYRFFETISRPAHLATDGASVQATMLHALRTVEERSPGFRADALVVLYGNVPVRGDGAIDRCVEHLQRTGCDSVRTFAPVGKWNPAWMSTFDGDAVVPLHPGSTDRRQDLPATFLHDGGCVAVSRESMLRGETTPEDPHAFFGADRRGVVCEPGENVEVDTPFDLAVAKAALQERSRTPMRMAS